MTPTKRENQPDPKRPVRNTRPETADFARGANGLNEDNDVEALARGMVAAQMRMMTTAVQTTADMTATGFRVMSAMWSMTLPKRADKKDKP